MKTKNTNYYIVTVLSLLLLAGCGQAAIKELTRHELFSLGIGKMDNQIDLFQIEGELFNQKNRIFMRDGLFYIANGNSSKIMQFSSYGDLIFLLYDPDSNPQPVSFNSSSSTGLSSTRIALPYPLRRIGELVIDSKKWIYVEDFVSEERRVKDKSLNIILNRVILRFDRHGNLQDFIGQEGVGGTPFPYIDSLHISVEDELVVVCRTLQNWLVFWFSRSGSLRYQVEIDQDHLPPLEAEEEVIPVVAMIVPDAHRPILYLLLCYYLNTIAESTDVTTTVENFSSRIYSLNLFTGRYENTIEIPQSGFRKEQFGSRQIEVPAPSYELLGVSAGGHFFLIRREDANLFQLLILDNDGRIASRRYLVMEDSELYYKEVKLSSAGIIYALLCEKYRSKIVWWRSDKLLREE